MDFQSEEAAIATLKAVAYRLSSLAPNQLPKAVLFLANNLSRCRAALSATKSGSSQTVVHKYRTQISSLIQDRSFEGRWSAVVLIKATIENGGLPMLQSSAPWV